MRLLCLVCAGVFGLASTASVAATFVVVNADPPGVGFNDTTAVAPVGANTATTLGAQRLAVLDAALGYWGARLHSDVPIHVHAFHQEGTCTETSSFIANGEPVTGHVVEVEGQTYWHTVAHRNALAGVDITPANAVDEDYDILLRVNPLIDTGCAGVDGFWYDTDANALPSTEWLPYLAVMKLELARGLGQWVYGDPDTGSLAGNDTLGYHPDILDAHLLDADHGRWSEIGQIDRALSARNASRLTWDGPAVAAATEGWLDPAPVVVVHRIDGDTFEFLKGELGPQPALAGTLVAPVVAVVDGTEPASDGCEAPVNAAALAGNIALVDRGNCTFSAKAMAAQNAGAIAVLVANNVAGHAPSPMGGTEPALAIPALGITQAAGASLRAHPARVSIGYDVFARAATTNGRVRMNAEAEPPASRSITRFASAAVPMATPRYLYGHTADIDDLSFAMLRDIGWPVSETAPNVRPYMRYTGALNFVPGQESTLTELWFGDIDSEVTSLQLEVWGGGIVIGDAQGNTRSGAERVVLSGSRSTLMEDFASGAVRFLWDENGSAGLTVTIRGAGGPSQTGFAVISAVANGTPTVTDQSLDTTVGAARLVELTGTDPDGDGLAFQPVTQPQHGTLSTKLSRVIYTPDPGFEGTDSFDFVALDGVLISEPATVTLTVEGTLPQTITNFHANPAQPSLADGSFVVFATGGASGNPVTFSIAPASAAICSAGGPHGQTIAILAAGTCTVLADQAGNASYDAAAQRTLAVTILAAPRLVRDGGFEAGVDGTSWVHGSSNFGSPLCDPPSCGTDAAPRSGAFWAWFGGTTAAETAFVEQTGVIGPDQRTLRFFLWTTRSDGVTPDPIGRFQVTIDGDPVFTVTRTTAASYGAGYKPVSVDVSAWADGGEHTLRFELARGAGSALPDFHLDEVTLWGNAENAVFADGFE